MPRALDVPDMIKFGAALSRILSSTPALVTVVGVAEDDCSRTDGAEETTQRDTPPPAGSVTDVELGTVASIDVRVL